MVIGIYLESTQHKDPTRTQLTSLARQHSGGIVENNVVVDTSNLVEANLISPAGSLGHFGRSLGR
jgi:hypothetical protein